MGSFGCRIRSPLSNFSNRLRPSVAGTSLSAVPARKSLAQTVWTFGAGLFRLIDWDDKVSNDRVRNVGIVVDADLFKLNRCGFHRHVIIEAIIFGRVFDSIQFFAFLRGAFGRAVISVSGFYLDKTQGVAETGFCARPRCRVRRPAFGSFWPRCRSHSFQEIELLQLRRCRRSLVFVFGIKFHRNTLASQHLSTRC